MQLRFYKGDYPDIYKVVEAYPNGGKPGDFVTIRDQVLFWHPERGNWIAEQHGIGSNAAILFTLLEMRNHLNTVDDEIAKLWSHLSPTPVVTETYWYGWNADPAELMQNLTYDGIKAYAKASGSSSQTVNKDFENAIGQCVWVMYEATKTLDMVVKQNGYEATVSWYQLGTVENNGTTYIVKAFDFAGSGTISSISIS